MKTNRLSSLLLLLPLSLLLVLVLELSRLLGTEVGAELAAAAAEPIFVGVPPAGVVGGRVSGGGRQEEGASLGVGLWLVVVIAGVSRCRLVVRLEVLVGSRRSYQWFIRI